jgi:hypothetical protein
LSRYRGKTRVKELLKKNKQGYGKQNRRKKERNRMNNRRRIKR